MKKLLHIEHVFIILQNIKIQVILLNGEKESKDRTYHNLDNSNYDFQKSDCEKGLFFGVIIYLCLSGNTQEN